VFATRDTTRARAVAVTRITPRNRVARRVARAAVTCTIATSLFACGKSDDMTSPSPGSSSPPLSHLSLFPARLVVPVGETLDLQVTARDVGGAAVSNVVPQYTSSNPGAVRVEGPSVRAVGVGTATLRASAGGQTAEAVVHVGAATYDYGALGAPRVLEANYIDLSKIERVSRFRSTVGHSFTTGVESCRSMKHYFQPKVSLDWTSVDVYAPAAGTIWLIRSDGGLGYQVSLRPRALAALTVMIFHVNLDPGLVRGTWVEAGDHIGRHASSSTMSDIALLFGNFPGGTLISFFESMTDAVFAQFQARGVPSREAAIITQAERDADPVPCAGEQQFLVHGRLPDWIDLH
jgi:hypothetical protein